MVQFADPFIGNIPKKMSQDELVQAIRADLAGELEAIVGYDAHYHSTDDQRIKNILAAIRDEEIQHTEMLKKAIELLDTNTAQFHQKGATRFEQTMFQNANN